MSTLSEWTLFDADGDGNKWGVANSGLHAHSGSGVLFSESYINDEGALTPDNWVFTSAVNLTTDNYVSFWVTAQDLNYPEEHYAVYISTGEHLEGNLNSCTLLMEQTYPNGNPVETDDSQGYAYQHFVVKIPASFNNKTAYIGLRHFDCTDWFVLCVDDLSVTQGDPTKQQIPAAAPAKTGQFRIRK